MKNKLLCLIFGDLYAKRRRMERLIRKFNNCDISAADYVKWIDAIVNEWHN